jgi:hypothetical protein
MPLSIVRIFGEDSDQLLQPDTIVAPCLGDEQRAQLVIGARRDDQLQIGLVNLGLVQIPVDLHAPVLARALPLREAAHLAAELVHVAVERIVHDGLDELLLGRIMMEHRAARDFRRLGDQLRGGAGVADIGQAFDRGVQDRDARIRTLALLQPGGRRREARRLELREIDGGKRLRRSVPAGHGPILPAKRRSATGIWPDTPRNDRRGWTATRECVKCRTS